MTNHGRTAQSVPANVLRAALGTKEFPLIRAAAEHICREAATEETWGACATRLGVSRRALERLRGDFPHAFEQLGESSK